MATDPLSLDFGRDKRFYVYLYRDPRPRKRLQPIYVGKGQAERADTHWTGRCKNPFLRRVLAKVRRAGLKPIIEIVGWFDNEPDAFQLECALIVRFGRKDQRKGPLCNLTNGGEGTVDISEITRAKISASRKDFRHSPETCAFLSTVWLGRKHKEETKAKIGAAHRGIKDGPMSQAARDKMSLTRKGRRHPVSAIENMSLARKLSWQQNPNQGTSGRRHSEETLAKMRDAWVKRKADPSTREKMLEAWAQRDREEFGAKMRALWTPELREKVSAQRRANPSFLGKKHTEEAKAKIRAARLARRTAD